MRIPITITHLPPPKRTHIILAFALYAFSVAIVFAAIGGSLYIALH